MVSRILDTLITKTSRGADVRVTFGNVNGRRYANVEICVDSDFADTCAGLMGNCDGDATNDREGSGGVTYGFNQAETDLFGETCASVCYVFSCFTS